jgi:predicted RNA binding protein YcfA (HicA-like mRNA interferase family)
MSPRIPSLTPRQVIKILIRKRAGFYICHEGSRGGHIHLCHPNDPTIRVDIPVHAQELKRKTLMSILKQANLTQEEFLRLL